MVTKDASLKLAGYIYQFHRALYRIFSSEHNSVVFGIETEDDIVEKITFDNGKIEINFEQDKHTTNKTGQPFQDSSKNLWHTLHIWLHAMEKTRKKYDNVCYCLVTNKQIGASTLAKQLSEANSDQQVAAAINALKDHAKTLKSSAKEIAAQVLTYSEECLIFLIKNIETLDKHGTDSGAPPKEATIQLLHLPEELQSKAEDIYSSLLGQLVELCQTSWTAKQSVILVKTPFFNRLQAEISKARLRAYIDQPLFSTTYKELLEQDNDDHLFIKQLQRLGLPSKWCNVALNHYWGFYAERVRLQIEGNILPSDWNGRSDNLYQRWLQIKMNHELKAKEDPPSIDTFKDIYTATLDPDFRAPLGAYPTENGYFTSGNYHDLANKSTHEMFVYWHIDYEI